MESVQDIDGIEEPLVEAVTVVAPAPQAPVPYAFARDNGLLVESVDADHAVVAMREGAKALALLELRSALGRELSVNRVSAGEFEKLLADAYAMEIGRASCRERV